MTILNHDPEHFFLCHLIRSLYLVNITNSSLYSCIQWNIYVKPLHIPLPLLLPPPFTGLIVALDTEVKPYLISEKRP